MRRLKLPWERKVRGPITPPPGATQLITFDPKNPPPVQYDKAGHHWHLCAPCGIGWQHKDRQLNVIEQLLMPEEEYAKWNNEKRAGHICPKCGRIISTKDNAYTREWGDSPERGRPAKCWPILGLVFALFLALQGPARADEGAKVGNLLLIEQTADVVTTQVLLHKGGYERDPLTRPIIHDVPAQLVLVGLTNLWARKHPHTGRIAVLLYLPVLSNNVRVIWRLR